MRQLKISSQITDRNHILDLYLQEIGKINILSTEKENELALRIHDGDKNALTELVKANLRFVVSVSKQYQNQGLGLSDLINEGNLGLITAAARFDKTRGFKFITYAVWWIRQSIMHAITQDSRMVRLPVNKICLRNKVNKTFNLLSHEFLREPTINELSDELEMKPNDIEDLLNFRNNHISMDTSSREDDENNLYDRFCLDDKLNPEAELINGSLSKDIEYLLSNLTKRDASILRSYFGFNNCINQSMDLIGHEFGLSAERVRQIINRSLKTLKSHNCNCQFFKEYLYN